MKYFIDTEFHEEPGILDLISLGIVNEVGDEWYGVSGWFDDNRCNLWVKEHVLTNLADPRYPQAMHRAFPHRKNMAHSIISFIGADTSPEFWGYYSDYDWVAFCQIFGAMMALPPSFPRFCLDLKQIIHTHNVSYHKLPKAFKPEHNALIDARWTRAVHQELVRMTYAR